MPVKPEPDSKKEQAQYLLERLRNCDLCPRRCRIDRMVSAEGLCGAGANLKVAAHHLHFGEEPPISGSCGSGTIFLTGCNLKCAYCQNYEISQMGRGREITELQFVEIMLSLQDSGAHNINFVTPTHLSAQIFSALVRAKEKGLRLPVVYNSSGYDAVDVLQKFVGMIDIYMPDMRYGETEAADCYSAAPDYPEVNRLAIREMYKQVGDLRLDAGGVATGGLLIRHLVLPRGLAGTAEVLSFIASKISRRTYISLMSQYHPAYRAQQDERLGRRINSDEYREAVALTKDLDLTNVYYQGLQQ
jgi:putative pyruvate formate lyase activating enzyme